MEETISNLEKRWKKIKEKGYIKSVKKDCSGVGRTLEHLLGIEENNFELPDYFNIELKAQNKTSKEYITLFSLTPTRENSLSVEQVRNKYGYRSKYNPEQKLLEASLFYQQKVEINHSYLFIMGIDEKKQTIYLESCTRSFEPIEKFFVWTWQELEEKINRKIKILAFFEATTKYMNGSIYYKYNKMTIYRWRDFDTFIKLIKEGKIKISIRIGIYKSGPKKGQVHDHGTSFCISKKNLDILFKKQDLE